MKLCYQRRHASVLPVLAALAGLGLMVVGLVVWLVYSSISVGGNLRSMRGAVLDGLDLSCASKVEVSVRPWLVGLARLGLHFAPVEPEARAALAAFHGAEVGVYQLSSHPDAAKRRALVHTVTKLMKGRDWEPTVTVLNRDELVMVFTPERELNAGNLSVQVFVLHERKLVLVSGGTNLEAITELVRGKVHEGGLPPPCCPVGGNAD